MIERAVAELPPAQAAVLTMRDVVGFESSEICNVLDISETNQRVLLQTGSLDLATLLAGESLYCDLTRLIYFYHRVTPEHYPTRFDTHFYLAALPPDR